MVKRVIYPPVWMVLGVVLVFVISRYLPGPQWASEGLQVVGSVVIAVGLLLLVLAGGLFKKAGTDLVPFKKVTALVTTGVYRYTRNPMYLGMALILFGCVMTVGAAYALPVPLLFMLVIQWRYILPEEAMLRGLFPKEFPAYCATVRRWL